MPKLKIDNFQQKVELPKLEQAVLEYWDEVGAFEKSVSSRPADKPYVFYDGPPFATGLPHYGHILASTIKDVIPRYWTMKGRRVSRVWGWDCHGIPIENMIEKELDLKGGKKGIESLGIDKFNSACRSAILRFDKEWEKVVRRIGRWVDFKSSYKTMDKSYMESVWWAFKSLWDKGLVYEGKRVILYCPRCATPLSNFEIAMDNSYKDLPGPSTVYKFKLKELENTYLLAWSTTPWNKLATPALAVNPDLTYVRVNQGNEHYILAESTTDILDGEFAVVEKYSGGDLQKFSFELHYDFYPERKAGERAGIIIADSYVTADEGTGVVTLAVYGEDDYRVMMAHKVQLVYHVDDEGKLKAEVTPWAGMFMLKVNPLVNEDLKKRGLIYKDEERLHSVPVCYRCETRLYHAPVPAWFIDVAKLRPLLIKQNENINWYPGYLKHGRFGNGLESAPDWNISRSRYWGTPMPVWKNQNGENTFRIIGSLAELKKWAVEPAKVEKLTDIHREFLDDIEVWVDDAKTLKGKRIPEVFDCWVESGSMPYASIGYPFTNKDKFEKSHPAQFIAEYIAQTRAWFYTLHVMSVGLFGKHTFENAVTTGTILAEDGSKMSKSKKNYPDPSILFEKYGVDALRFYLMGSVVMKGENVNFSESQVREIYQKLVSTSWNVLAFYKLYAQNAQPPQSLPQSADILDRWMVSLTERLTRDVTLALDGYDTVAACRCIQGYVTNLSTWYLRRSRERLKTNAESVAVFGWSLYRLTLVLAPLTPFIAELMYQNLTKTDKSVHWENWPVADLARIDDEFEKFMELARSLVEGVHGLRKKAAIPVRQALGSWAFVGKASNIFSKYPEIIRVIEQEINVLSTVQDETILKSLQQKSGIQTATVLVKDFGQFTVYLDTEITPVLAQQGQIRELIREVQQLRKDKGLQVAAKITLLLPRRFSDYPKDLLNRIKNETLAESLVWTEEKIPSIG